MVINDFLRSRTMGDLTADELLALQDSITDIRHFQPRTIAIKEGAHLTESTLLIDGLMTRYSSDRKGNRQLVALQVSGDFLDLHAYPLMRLDHDVGTLTACEVAVLSHDRIWKIQKELPELARKLWFLTLLDAAMNREWVFRLGRLKAPARLAHFICEMNARLFAVGKSDGREFELSVTQFDLAEICGLTSVHVNRVVRQLREMELCLIRDGVVEILNYRELVRFSDFDPDYLYLKSEVLERLDQGPGAVEQTA